MNVQSAPTQPQDTSDRIHIVTDWLNAAHDIARKVDMQTVNEVYNFAAQRSAVACTAFGKLKTLHIYQASTPPKDQVFITPIMASDAALVAKELILFDYAQQQRADLYFDEGAMAIYFPGQKSFTQTGRGIMLLTMLQHAKYHAEGVYMNGNLHRDPDMFYQEEAAADIFEYGILERIGGKSYSAIVEAFCQAIRTQQSLSLDDPAAIALARTKQFKKVFGDDLPDDELHVWGAIAQANAVYLTLSRQNRSNGLPEAENVRSMSQYLRQTHPQSKIRVNSDVQAAANILNNMAPGSNAHKSM